VCTPGCSCAAVALSAPLLLLSAQGGWNRAASSAFSQVQPEVQLPLRLRFDCCSTGIAKRTQCLVKVNVLILVKQCVAIQIVCQNL
jgi:hypothetical protein